MGGSESENRKDLRGMKAREIGEWAGGFGLEPYRGRQIRQWLLGKGALSFDEMTNLPKSLRRRLEEEVPINTLEPVRTLVSCDGTRKVLFRLADGPYIESVLIPERDHFTLCISSQAGCAMGCTFCLTARQGLKRDLRASEIVEQVIRVRRSMDDPTRLTNIVFMGMGEPLANYGEVLRALDAILAQDGMNFSHRRVTLSTCGLAPRIRRLGAETTVNLAVSLNAADDETRTLLMPVNRRYPLTELLSACRRFPLPNRRMITFEYILIAGINDRDEDAKRLGGLLSDLRAKINLIPLNPHPTLDMAPPSMERILAFQEILVQNHYTAMIRKSKGQDISAACGQLSGSIREGSGSQVGTLPSA